MTKNQAIEEFKEIYPEILNSDDRCFKQLTWSEFTDFLCKEGRITQKQFSTWDNPSFCK